MRRSTQRSLPGRPRGAARRPLGRRLLLTASVLFTAISVALPSPTQAVSASGVAMEAEVLLGGNARTGSWMAIDVHLTNSGPPVVGEIRLAGGAQGRTRFGAAVDLPTQSDKTYRLYAQPLSFGREITIDLVSGDSTLATTKADFTLLDVNRLVVGIVAERAGDIIGSIDLPPGANGVAPVTVAIDAADLPARVEAWGTLDRLVWQDTESSRLSTEQLDALRGWVAGGGRLVIVGGTSGPASLSAFSDLMLPFRPTATTDVTPASLGALLGEIPDDAKDMPALSGELAEGRALVSVGDRVVAADRSYGGGAVTIIGFDPTVEWIATTDTGGRLWGQLLPPRTQGGPVIGDDSQIVSAASQLPSLALPPTGGLIALLGAYILLIGPVNYLVLRRLDKREWAWVTMPVLILAFAAGAYGFGSLLRGSDLIINEVAIVRGSPGATDGTAQIYLGVFSPGRGTYQLRVPGGALLSSPMNGDFMGGDGSTATLDVLQGDPAQVRNLGVGFGSLRTVRADTATSVPLVQADLQLKDGRLQGSVTNASNEVLLKPAVVLGGTVAKLADLAPGATATVDIALQPVQIGQQLSDKIVGQIFGGETGQMGDDAARMYARHTIVDQLTFDPSMGFTGQLPSDGPVILAWSDQQLLPVEIEGATPRRTGNILWFLPTGVTISGTTTFRNDLLRSTVISSDAAFFNKDPFTINFGRGSAELSYRPIAFDGTLKATQLAIGLNFGDPGFVVDPTLIEPLPSIPAPCDAERVDGCQVPNFDGLPEVELYDLTAGEWKRMPHFTGGARYAIAEPDRYVDPATGTVLIRLVNDNSDGVGFSMDLSITGELE